MRIDAFEQDILRNAITHDQDLFAAPEMMVLRNQTYAPSRRALLLELVRSGYLKWTPDIVDAIYAAINAGTLHAFSVYRGEEQGWPDEADYVRAARADIVEAGFAPPYALHVQAASQENGTPFGALEQFAPSEKAEVIHFIDAASLALTPDAVESERALFSAIALDSGEISGNSAGYELFDLGFREDAAQAISRVLELVAESGAKRVVTSSPEAIVALNRFAAELGLQHDLDITHLSTWMLESGLDASAALDGVSIAICDSPNLVRTLRAGGDVRDLLTAIGSTNRTELTYFADEVISTGPFLGYPFPEAIPEMAQRVIDDAESKSVQQLVTCSPYDTRNLNAAIDRQSVEIVDLAKCIARARED